MTQQRGREQPPEDRQKHVRHSVLCRGILRARDGVHDCAILDLSLGGAKVRADGQFETGRMVTLEIEGFGKLIGSLVWQSNDIVGIDFTDPPEDLQRFLEAQLKDQADPAERREQARRSVMWGALALSSGLQFKCVVLNISAGGAKVRIAQPFSPGTPVTLMVTRFGEFPAIVVWESGEFLGLKFQEPPDVVARRLA